MSDQLREILQQCAVGQGGDKRKAMWHTHVSQVQPHGKYAIGRSHLEDFWNEYCEVVASNHNPMLGLAERPKDYGPVLVDIDLKIDHPESSDLTKPFYTEDHIIETIEAYQSVLRQIVEGCTDDHLTCVVLERPPYRPNPDSDAIKNGFHLQFTNVFLTEDAQRVHLIPRVRDIIKEQETFDVFVPDSGSVVDDVSGKHWLMYGSTKNELVEPYRVTKVYNYDCKEIPLEEAFKDHVIYDMDEEIINIRGNVEYYLPRILSIVQHHRPSSQIKKGVACPVMQKAKRNKTGTKKLTMDVADGLRQASKLLPMLADHRAIDRDEWMAVGWALYNIGEGCPEALDLWLQHSQRSKDYNETGCVDAWTRMVPRGVTLRTLHFYAKVDNPIKYGEFQTECVDHYIKEAIDGSHYDIAQILHAEYGDEFVCAQIKPPIWFQFVNHRWKEIDEGTYLFNKISREVVSKFTSIGKRFMTRLGESDELTATDKSTNAKIDRVTKLIGSLKNHGYKKNVMLEAAHAFYDERFKRKLDQDPDLVAFQNGVYDLKRNVFRAGRPEDFISQAMPISYHNYLETDDAVMEVNEFFMKVLPDTEVRNFFMDIYSDVFVGGNPHKIVLVWTGCGNNGKSIAQHLFEDMLGVLAVKLPTTLFSGQKVKAGAANPEMVRLAPPCRWGAAEEPDGGESLNIGLIKSMTGGDKMGVRDLFQKGKEVVDVKPMFLLTFITNKLPRIKQSDPAFWDRMKVIPFESVFVRPGQPCPETFAEQLAAKKFPMDMHFSTKIPDMLAPLAWVLLEHRKKPTMYFEPEKVREATNAYRRQNDDYRKFIQEQILEDVNGLLPLDQLFTQFRFWFNDSYPNRRHDLPDKDAVKEYFLNSWGESSWDRNKFVGYRLRGIDDDLEGESVAIDASALVTYGEDGNVIGSAPI